MDLTEHTLHSEPVYDGVLLHARRDRVRLPDGGESVREWIAHPGAAAVVPVFEDGSTILLRQFRYGPRREFLEVPAGKIDHPGEDPADVARRELEEEAGWVAGRVERVGETYPCIGYSDEVIHLFVAENLTRGQEGAEDDEFVVPVRMPLEEAVRMAREGEILDAKSCVALLLAASYLERR